MAFVTLDKRADRRLGVLLCFLLVLVLGGKAAAAKHPVPLDPKADPATCLTCHEDKTKGKSVHSAMAMGCLSCHEIRVNRDITHVKLITATPYKLCLTCHADKDSTQIKGRVHPPAVRDCLTCHNPHTSENKNQLLKLTSGEKKDNLCLTCHTRERMCSLGAAGMPRWIWVARLATRCTRLGTGGSGSLIFI